MLGLRARANILVTGPSRRAYINWFKRTIRSGLNSRHSLDINARGEITPAILASCKNRLLHLCYPFKVDHRYFMVFRLSNCRRDASGLIGHAEAGVTVVGGLQRGDPIRRMAFTLGQTRPQFVELACVKMKRGAFE